MSVRGIHEVDADFLEHLRREALYEPELPWEPCTRAAHADFGLAKTGISGYTAPMLHLDGPRTPGVPG